MMEKYDLIVVGGGFAGFGAAVCAAREGVKTLLIEKSNALSGAANTSLILSFMPFETTVGKDENGKTIKKRLSAEIFSELLNKLKAADSLSNLCCDNEYLKLLMNRMAIKAGVELLFNATVTAAKREANAIKSLTVFSRGNTDEFAADYFIDSTGDANLAAISGFPFNVGRESDGLCQPMTACFKLINVDYQQVWKSQVSGETDRLYRQFKADGKIKNLREDVLIFRTLPENTLHFNTTRTVKLNPTDMFAVTKAEIEAGEQIYEMFNFLKNNISGFENSHIISTASEIGIRESRMIEGEYTLTGNEIIKCARFSDSIATGNYDVDIHNPEGEGTSHYYFPLGEYYEIPYRTLIPKIYLLPADAFP